MSGTPAIYANSGIINDFFEGLPFAVKLKSRGSRCLDKIESNFSETILRFSTSTLPHGDNEIPLFSSAFFYVLEKTT